MKAVIQRVSRAEVRIDGQAVGAIGEGMVVLLGVAAGDTDGDARALADKVAAVEASGADTLLAGDLGCLLNLSGKLRREGKSTRVFHVAEVLAGMADCKAIGEGDN